jgi:Flp pilus assembly protein TadD
MSDIAPASGRQQFTAWCMAGLLLILFVTAAGYRVLHPDLLTPLPSPQERAGQNAAQRMPTGMDENVAALMRQLQESPNDVPALLGLAEYFLRRQDWATAERFARRAVVAAPEDLKPRYLLGMSLHGLDRNEEAAACLEQALHVKEEPSLRYSLAMLYAYYLNDKEKAAAQLRRGLADPALPGRLKTEMEEELGKLEGK